MKARILALLLALVMVASLFAACSAGKTDASGASTGASQTTDDQQDHRRHEARKDRENEDRLLARLPPTSTKRSSSSLQPPSMPLQDEYELSPSSSRTARSTDSKTMQAVRNGTGPDLVNMYPSDAVNYLNEGPPCRPVRLHQRPGDRHPELQG